MSSQSMTMSASGSRGLNVALWIAQGLLALAFATAGWMKAATEPDELAMELAWVMSVPEVLVRAIGVCELLGAVGVILPVPPRLRRWVTAPSALALALLMASAMVFHAVRGEFALVPVPITLGALASFVAWGRGVRRPGAPP